MTAARRPISRQRLALAGVALILSLGAAWYAANWWTVGRFVETTDDAYVGGDVTTIAPHVAGFVQQIGVADNQFVEAGQTLVRLDVRDVQAALEHASSPFSPSAKQHSTTCGRIHAAAGGFPTGPGGASG